MRQLSRSACLWTALLALLARSEARCDDWPQWGGSNSRNMVSSETGLPADFSAGKKLKGSEEVDMATTKNCLWAAKLGSQSYGSPNIADGRMPAAKS